MKGHRGGYSYHYSDTLTSRRYLAAMLKDFQAL